MKKLISIIIPAYNEEAVLQELKRRLQLVMDSEKKYNFEVIIVENGSYDSSFRILLNIRKEDPRFKIIQLSRNFGMDNALVSGLKYAKGDAAILMNADLQDPPEMIPHFLRRWEAGYEIIYGVIRKRKGVPLFNKLLQNLFYKVIYRLTNKAVPKNVADFRLIDKKVYHAVNTMEERNKFLRGLVVWTGFRQIGVPFIRPKRHAGRTKFNFIALVKVAMNGIFSFSYFPLTLTLFMGLFVSLASFIMLIAQFINYLIQGRVVPGYFSLILIILFLFGMLFFMLGIIGIYIARIYDEVKKRPNFIIREKIGLD